MLDRPEALEILEFADRIRPHCLDENGNLSVTRVLEVYLPSRIENFVWEVEADLYSDRKPKRLVSAYTKFDPTTWMKIEAGVYAKALQQEPSAVFTIMHEMWHALKDGTAAARSSGDLGSFRETPKQEFRANYFSGAIMIPRDLIGPSTTVNEILAQCVASRPIAERQLKNVRAVHPEKWSPGWNR